MLSTHGGNDGPPDFRHHEDIAPRVPAPFEMRQNYAMGIFGGFKAAKLSVLHQVLKML
jgi:hypothetical protein